MLWVVWAPIKAEEAMQMCFLAYHGPLVINEQHRSPPPPSPSLHGTSILHVMCTANTYIHVNLCTRSSNLALARLRCIAYYGAFVLNNNCGTCWRRGCGWTDGWTDGYGRRIESTRTITRGSGRVLALGQATQTVILFRCTYSTLGWLEGKNPWASLSATFPLHLRHSNSTLLLFYFFTNRISIWIRLHNKVVLPGVEVCSFHTDGNVLVHSVWKKQQNVFHRSQVVAGRKRDSLLHNGNTSAFQSTVCQCGLQSTPPQAI